MVLSSSEIHLTMPLKPVAVCQRNSEPSIYSCANNIGAFSIGWKTHTVILLAESIGEHHGYGLKNINRIVQENHGDFYTKKKDGVFTVQVRLNCEN